MGFEPTRAGATILCLNHLTTAAILFFGAGEGDRTLATGLEGRGSTTELHPRGSFLGAKDGIRTRGPRLGKAMLYQLSHFRVKKQLSDVRKCKVKRYKTKKTLSKKLQARSKNQCISQRSLYLYMVEGEGFEPS